MAGRASIVGAAETNVGRVRDHNEDSHYIDPDLGIFLVCDGMGGHAAGEVASALAVQMLRKAWSSAAVQEVAETWLRTGTPDARKELIGAVQASVVAAHDRILSEGNSDTGKSGMGTTLIGALVVGGDVVFAQAGDSRAYLVRDGIAMQLTEDHTLLARLLAAGVDVDVTAEGMRFKSMLTNALGIGEECKVTTFVVPVADGDRFLLCSDGITEYVQEPEIGEVLCKMPSPARAAQKLIDLALERGGGDNATALVIRVLEAGETARPSELLRRDQAAIAACPLWAKLSPQQRLRAQRIALPREHVAGARVPAQTLGDRVAWVILEGEVEQGGNVRGPGTLLYPEALLGDRPLPDKDGLAVTRGEVRALALRNDDFHELCDYDSDLGEALLSALAEEIAAAAARSPGRRTGKMVVAAEPDVDVTRTTDPGMPVVQTGTPARSPADDFRRDETRPGRRPTRLDTDTGVAPLPEPPAPPPRTPAPPLRPPAPSSTRPPAVQIPPLGSLPPRTSTTPSRGVALPPKRPAPPQRAQTAEPIKRPSRPSGLIVPVTERAEAEGDIESALMRLAEGAAPLNGEPEPPPAKHAPPRSEPEIQIEALAEADSREIEMVVDDGPSAKIVEVVQESSTKTISLTVVQPPEPEIVVIESIDDLDG